MSEWLTIRLDDGLRARLSDAAQQHAMDVSALVRQAVLAYLDAEGRTTPTAPASYDREACAQAMLTGCPPDIRHELSTRIRRAGLTLAQVLEALLILAAAPCVDHAMEQGVQPSMVFHEALVLWLNGASKVYPGAGSRHSAEDCT